MGTEWVSIRGATVDDAEALMRIYNHEVETSTATFDLVPRTLEEQRDWITERQGALGAVVAIHDRSIVGFASLSKYKPRPAYNTSVEDSVYIDANARGMGVGKLLLNTIVDEARANGFHTVIARIVADHEASIALHRSCGFHNIGTEKEIGRKFGKWLDVVIMQRMLN